MEPNGKSLAKVCPRVRRRPCRRMAFENWGGPAQELGESGIIGDIRARGAAMATSC